MTKKNEKNNETPISKLVENGKPDVDTSTLDVKEVEKFFLGLLKRVKKLIHRQQNYMRDNNETTDGLLLFLDKYPQLFAAECDMINRDIIKWSLYENMKKNRELIDKIQEIEKRLGLEIHHEW